MHRLCSGSTCFVGHCSSRQQLISDEEKKKNQFDVEWVCFRQQTAQFAFTMQAVGLLERVAVCVAKNEPVLLVGETGTGKTSSVQYLAQQMGKCQSPWAEWSFWLVTCFISQRSVGPFQEAH